MVSLRIVCVCIVEIDSPIVSILHVTITSSLWALFVGSCDERLQLGPTTYGDGQCLKFQTRNDGDDRSVLEFSVAGMQRRLFLIVPSLKSSCLIAAIGHSSQLIEVSPGVLFKGSWSF